jgi:hypothetical protein
MNFRIALLSCCLFILIASSPCWADTNNDGVKTFMSGDYPTAFKIFTPLAEQGNAGAQFNLGRMYDDGQGVPQDYKLAVKWYSAAAEQGISAAQHNVGVMYVKGQGVPVDYIQAYAWFSVAATNGEEEGKKSRDSLASEMTPSQLEKGQQLAKEIWARLGN